MFQLLSIFTTYNYKPKQGHSKYSSLVFDVLLVVIYEDEVKDINLGNELI